jgi:hypothetical protein
MAMEVASIIAAKAIMSTMPGSRFPIRPPPKAPAMPAAPKTRPVRHLPRPFRAWVAALTSDVTPTTKRDVVIASFGSNPAT